MQSSEILDAFATQFAVPLLRGQPCIVGLPWGPSALLAIRSGVVVDTRIQDAAETLWIEAGELCSLTPAPFDEEAGILLFALHELCASVHPAASSGYPKTTSVCRAAAYALQTLSTPVTPERALMRHLIFDRALQITRTDKKVRWWTGSAAFYGEDPPERLLAWPSIRRVDVSSEISSLWILSQNTDDEELKAARIELWSALWRASPLTRLLYLGMNDMPTLPLLQTQDSPLYLLSHPQIARLVVDRSIDRGVELAGTALSLALLQGVREQTDPTLLRLAVALAVHLAFTLCWIESEVPNTPQTQALRTLIEDKTTLSEPLRIYWATVLAALDLDAARAVLPLPNLHNMPDENQPLPAVLSVFRSLYRALDVAKYRAISDPLMRQLQRRLKGALQSA